MTDLWIAAGVLVVSSIVTGIASWRLARKVHRRVTRAAVALTFLLMVIYSAFLWSRPALVRVVPFSNAIMLGNWLPLGAAIVSGLYLGRTHDKKRRSRWVLVGLLSGVGIWSAARFVVGSPPQCESRWQGDVCLQTSNTSCSAAAAVTLLKHHGIESTEAEMVELCLTRKNGTHWLGLYRGLCLKTKGTSLRVDVFEGSPSALKGSAYSPSILFMGLDENSVLASHYSERGWIPDVEHSVVLHGQDSQHRWEIADPAIGFERWPERDLALLWKGRGIRLVPRRP